jgi:hypothetical protein
LHRLGVDFVTKPTNLKHETHNLTTPSFEHVKSFTSGSSLLDLASFLDSAATSAPAFGFVANQ